jgi:hypothetical protein
VHTSEQRPDARASRSDGRAAAHYFRALAGELSSSLRHSSDGAPADRIAAAILQSFVGAGAGAAAAVGERPQAPLPRRQHLTVQATGRSTKSFLLNRCAPRVGRACGQPPCPTTVRCESLRAQPVVALHCMLHVERTACRKQRATYSMQCSMHRPPCMHTRCNAPCNVHACTLHARCNAPCNVHPCTVRCDVRHLRCSPCQLNYRPVAQKEVIAKSNTPLPLPRRVVPQCRVVPVRKLLRSGVLRPVPAQHCAALCRSTVGNLALWALTAAAPRGQLDAQLPSASAAVLRRPAARCIKVYAASIVAEGHRH